MRNLFNDVNENISDNITPALDNKVDISSIGVANGVAGLDSNGLIPSSQLPSYVDDVLEYSTSSSFPATGSTGKIYVALDTNKTYRWGGTEYVEISESLALGTTSSTAYRGDLGDQLNTKVGTDPLTTTAQDVSGAVNELNDTVNELSSTLNDKADISLLSSGDDHFQFGVDANGNYGYVKKIGGADTVIPFKTTGTRSTEITVNGTYIAKTDISKDGYESVTVAVPQPTPNLQSKTVAAGTTDVTVTPDASYDGLSSVVVQPTPSQTKSVTPSTSAQTVTPDSGNLLSSVSVAAIATQTKSATPSTSAQTITPDSGKYLSSVSVGAISTQTKSATPSTSAQTVSPDSGKFLTSVSVAAIPNLHTTNSMIVPRWGTGPGSSVPATRVATLNPRIDFNNSRQYGNVEMVEIAMPEGYYAWSYGNSSCCIPTETKTVTAGTSATTVTPTEYNTADKFVKFLKSVTVNPTPSQAKSTVAKMSNVTVSPDSGKYLSSVTVTPNVIKLWTNPSPTASFTTKDITISGGITAYKYIFFRVINITTRTDLESIFGFNTSNLFYWTITAENVSGSITTKCIANVFAHGSCTNWRPLCYINNTTLRFERNLTLLGKSDQSTSNYYNTNLQNRVIPLDCYGIKA